MAKKKKQPKAKAGKPAPALKARPRGMKVKPMPDLAKLEAFRERDTRPGAELLASRPGSYAPLSVLPDGLNEEQRAVKECGVQAQRLLKEEDVDSVIKTMITFRRGYAVAYREFQEMVARKRELAEQKGETLHPTLEDFLIQYAMYESSKPFNEHQFMQGMMQVVLPYMADVIDRHTVEEERATQADRLEAEEYRRKRPVPIGFKHTPQEEALALTKDRSLVLAGWRNALLWITDHLVNHVLAAKPPEEEKWPSPYMVVRFMTQAPKSKEQQRYLIRIGGSAWKGAADSQKRLALCMGEHVADKLSAQPDLLVVDDLAEAYTLGFVGRPAPAVAGDAQRAFRRWCDQAGCALVGLVPGDSKDVPDVTSPEWEQLRTFTHLRPVRVIEEAEGLDPDKYRLVVGNAAAAFEVSKEVLDSYGHGNIVLPAGVVNQ